MNKKLIAVSMATITLSTTMASDNQQKDLEVNAGDIVLKKRVSNYLSIGWKQSEGSIILNNFELTKNEPDSETDLTLIIPGKIDGKQVKIGEEAFNYLQSEKLRLHLVLQEKNGVKVQMPQSLGAMFKNSTALYSIDFSGASTENVTSMIDMFYGCESLKELNLSKFDTKNVTDMTYMFCGCKSLKELNLSNFNTQKVTEMGGMFYDCESLKELILSNFNTQNVTNMTYMFYDCSSLTELDVSKFNIHNVTDMGNMFTGCNENARDKIKSAFVRGNLHDFRSELNQICWHARCSERESLIKNNESDKKYDWILKEQYEDSRSKVIGKAIADCVTNQNEFAGKKADDIITFDNKPNSTKYLSPERYKPQHWNAVILYNYIHEVINNDKLPTNQFSYAQKVGNVRTLLSPKYVQICQHYQEHCGDVTRAIDKAIQDIQQYVDALNLKLSLFDFWSCKNEYNKDYDFGYPSLMHIVPKTDETKVSQTKIQLQCQFEFSEPNTEREDNKTEREDNKTTKATSYRPCFSYYNGSLYLSNFEKVCQMYHKNSMGTSKTIGPQIKYADFQRQGKWLWERLKDLKFVRLPDEKTWEKLNPKELG